MVSILFSAPISLFLSEHAFSPQDNGSSYTTWSDQNGASFKKHPTSHMGAFTFMWKSPSLCLGVGEILCFRTLALRAWKILPSTSPHPSLFLFFSAHWSFLSSLTLTPLLHYLSLPPSSHTPKFTAGTGLQASYSFAKFMYRTVPASAVQNKPVQPTTLWWCPQRSKREAGPSIFCILQPCRASSLPLTWLATWLGQIPSHPSLRVP